MTDSLPRGLDHEEPLAFEVGDLATSGVDIPEVDLSDSPLTAAHLRATAPDLPGLSEPEAARHYARLARQNYSIDTGFFPLGSCTMKHNPRFNEMAARLEGFALAHPLQPVSASQGSLAIMRLLGAALVDLTGMAAVALAPRAGAHGEACGMMAIRAALAARGEAAHRREVLIPESAHGTNPATAARLGFVPRSLSANADGLVDMAALRERISDSTAALMITNPNTCGLFERDIVEICERIHAVGGYVYCDGANFNAVVGRARPVDWGVDAMHINLHKTFSTPHGGGGPGAGPVALSAALAPFAPPPRVVVGADGALALDEAPLPGGVGRMASFHGQSGLFVRALAYIVCLGGDGLRQASADATLAANYLRARLWKTLGGPYDATCMHEVLFDDRNLKPLGVQTLDLAKGLIDEGFHPMTTYFPLTASGAMLVEPTETESLAALDSFVEAVERLMARVRAEGPDFLLEAPRHAPRRRLDEAGAARRPKLRWTR